MKNIAECLQGREDELNLRPSDLRFQGSFLPPAIDISSSVIMSSNLNANNNHLHLGQENMSNNNTYSGHNSTFDEEDDMLEEEDFDDESLDSESVMSSSLYNSGVGNDSNDSMTDSFNSRKSTTTKREKNASPTKKTTASKSKTTAQKSAKSNTASKGRGGGRGGSDKVSL
jgi:hypothetical protein